MYSDVVTPVPLWSPQDDGSEESSRLRHGSAKVQQPPGEFVGCPGEFVVGATEACRVHVCSFSLTVSENIF